MTRTTSKPCEDALMKAELDKMIDFMLTQWPDRPRALNIWGSAETLSKVTGRLHIKGSGPHPSTQTYRGFQITVLRKRPRFKSVYLTALK
jgi:hypothetical protein